MEKRYIPMDQLATQAQIDEMIETGWVYWGQVPMVLSQPVLTLDRPDPLGPKMCIALIRPEPMIPVSRLAGVVAGARNLSELALTLFRVPLEELRGKAAG